jgi:hypothetical protein
MQTKNKACDTQEMPMRTKNPIIEGQETFGA